MNKRVKVKQRDSSDCGAACLASVSAHYNLQIPVSRIRQYAGTDQRSTTFFGMLEAAHHLGFQAKGAKGGTLEVLPNIPLPAIAHLEIKPEVFHFVVIYKISKTHIWIMNPSDGHIHKTALSEFEKQWTGMLIVLLPDELLFKPRNEKTSNISRFWQLIQPHKTVMFAALLGALIYTILGLSTSIYIQKLVDFVFVEGNTSLLNALSLIMVLILVFQIIIGAIQTVFGIKTGQVIDAKLILGYYKHLMKLPQRFFDTMKVGEIMSRISDAVKIRVFINNVAINMVVNIFIVLFSIGLMFFYYWKLALIMLGIIPFFVTLYIISNKLNKYWLRRQMEDAADLESQLVESLNSVTTIKRFGLEDTTNLKTENVFIKLLRTIFSIGMRSVYLGNSTEFISRIFTIIILWAGSYFVINRELSPGELLSFYALIGYFTNPALSLINANSNIQDALIAADRLFEIIDLETEQEDAENNILLNDEQFGDIIFKDVFFRYGARAYVFENFNLTIPKGKSIGIVGESGSGKSTLLSILQNIYQLEKGNITISSIDIKHINNKQLRERISVVPQQINLFSGTIASNIAIGENDPDMQRVIGFAQLTGLHDFVSELPNNYFSMISEHGVNLSGGQKQKLAIARALYRNPDIFILDEATASLDPKSENQVHEALNWFHQQGKTLIIIAHRLKTIKNCDNIIVLHKGKIAETGTHNELLSKNGMYAEMWNNAL